MLKVNKHCLIILTFICLFMLAACADKTDYSTVSAEHIVEQLSKKLDKDVRSTFKDEANKVIDNELSKLYGYFSSFGTSVNVDRTLITQETVVNEDDTVVTTISTQLPLIDSTEYFDVVTISINDKEVYDVVGNAESSLAELDSVYVNYWSNLPAVTSFLDECKTKYDGISILLKASTKILNAKSLFPEEYQDDFSKHLVFAKSAGRYTIDYINEVNGEDISCNVMQITPDSSEFGAPIQDVDMDKLFNPDVLECDVAGKHYTVSPDDYESLYSPIKYNQTIYLDTAINNFSTADIEQGKKDSIIKILSFVKSEIDSHSLVIKSIDPEYPAFELVAVVGENMSTTVYAVNTGDIDPTKLTDAEYMVHAVKLFEIDKDGNYRNYMNKSRAVLYYNYYLWTLPPEDLGGDTEGNITTPGDLFEGGSEVIN